MKIFIDKDTLMPLFAMDQMLMIDEFKVVYKQFGMQGIVYTVLFGWTGSPYVKSTIKEDERDILVMDNINNTDIYDPVKEKFVTNSHLKAKEMYQLPAVKIAIKRLNQLCPVQLLELSLFYEEQIINTKRSIKDIDENSRTEKDPDKIGKSVAAKSKLFTALESLTRQFDEIQKKIETTMQTQTEASLNDFLPTYQVNQRNG